MQNTNKKEAILFCKWISKMSSIGRLELKDGEYIWREGSGVYAFWWDQSIAELYEKFKSENGKAG